MNYFNGLLIYLVKTDDAVSKRYVDAINSHVINTDGSNSMIGHLNLNNNRIIYLKDPKTDQDGCTKTCVDVEVNKNFQKMNRKR